MAKIKTEFECQECGYTTSKWLGKCPDCGQWNSFSEREQITKEQKNVQRSGNYPKVLKEIEKTTLDRITVGIGEFDRVVGGGLVPGSLSLIGGEPGIGKSTLLIDVCAKIAKKFPKEKILYVSGEESENQIQSRCERLGIAVDNLLILNETSWLAIVGHIKTLAPKFFILDSVQTTVSENLTSPAGTISQIREVTFELMNLAKTRTMTSFLIGHVTKEGNISGPKILEHMVDTVIYFEGDQYNQYRILRCVKNRFGNTNEVGIFEMQQGGLIEVPNPSAYFLEGSLEDATGRALTCVLEGTRPLFVEIQCLVNENKFGNGRRTTTGVDTNRLAMLVAVVEKFFHLPLGFYDIYLNVVGGLKLKTRESDLAVVAAILSSKYEQKIEEGTVFLGEVGLTGEIRRVPQFEMRLKELAQMNYKRIITSKSNDLELNSNANIEIICIERITDLKKDIFI